MDIKLYMIISLVAIGACAEPKEYSYSDKKPVEKNECFFDSTCLGCQRLGLPFNRHWASNFSNLNYLRPFIIHISFNEQYFEIVNNALIESEILIQRGKNAYYEAVGAIPTVKKLEWSDSTFYMIVQYFPYPKVNRNQPHPLTVGCLRKNISSALLSGQRILDYHYFAHRGDTLVQYFFEQEKKNAEILSLKEWMPQAMKISHPLSRPNNKHIRKNYIIEYFGNKCMCKSSLVKVFDKNPIHIKDSPDSFY